LTNCPVEATAQTPASEAFPQATPESQGIPTKNLQELAGVVRKFVEKDKIIGAELLVIKNRRVVLHEAIGMKDKERHVPMQPNTIFCVRSMTKPVNGVAVQMLIDEGKLSPDDLVSKYIPAFDNEKSKAITVKHLLTHTSGLPLSSSLKGLSYDTLHSMRDIADATGKRGPEHTPGRGFHYSDDNSDTLGAIVMQITGKPTEQFLQERLLKPLGMKDTLCVVQQDDPQIKRFSSAYAGTEGAWAKFWEPGRKPIFHFFLASQGMYATPLDYARFLAFLMDGGKVGDKQLLSKAALERIMTPAIAMEYPTNFDGVKVHYGQ
jgi:CubicO group peptidase (beta-lactamase class C family)